MIDECHPKTLNMQRKIGRMLRMVPSEQNRDASGLFRDESGLHSDGGKLSKLTIGGACSLLKHGKVCRLTGRARFAGYGIPGFHMTDFEARVPPVPEIGPIPFCQARL